MLGIQDLKKDFRIVSKQNLLNLDKNTYHFSDKQIIQCLKTEYERFNKFYTNIAPKEQNKIRILNVLVYLPMKLEVDIFPFIFWLKKKKNVRIFAPFIINDTFKIVPFRLPLRKNKYNIYETFNSTFISVNKIDLAIVPMLGMDIEFRRIGFGKGMYDRFYATLKHKPINIFISRILHCANQNITDDYDIKGDIVITNCAKQKRGNYGFVDNSWILHCRNSIIRTNILYRQKNLYIKTKNHYRTS